MSFSSFIPGAMKGLGVVGSKGGWAKVRAGRERRHTFARLESNQALDGGEPSHYSFAMTSSSLVSRPSEGTPYS